MGYKITIDGPAGAGKGFVASELSKRLNILNIDTGAMYRAFGLYAKINNVDLEDEIAVNDALEKVKLEFKYDQNIVKIYMNGVDVSNKIRTEEIGFLASKVSAIPSVRHDMVKRQREIAGSNSVVMEGRDIGSVVFKDAELKIYLTASVLERAKRRQQDFALKGQNINLEQVISDINERDEKDITKPISPLIITDDMIEVDTTNLTKEQVIEKILDLVKKKGLVK